MGINIGTSPISAGPCKRERLLITKSKQDSGLEITSYMIRNKSQKIIDSLIIDANGTLIKFYDVPFGKMAKQNVDAASIKSGHDIKMTPVFFIQSEQLKGAYFYNDLAGFSGSYKLILNEKLEATWEIVN